MINHLVVASSGKASVIDPVHYLSTNDHPLEDYLRTPFKVLPEI
jgi:hypothetical protein